MTKSAADEYRKLTKETARLKITDKDIEEAIRETRVGNMTILHKEEDMYVAECPQTGTVSQGKTKKEAAANLKEATELFLEEFPKKREKKEKKKK